MASYTPNGKRRRLEQATTALSKPFKSPLRRPTPTVKKEAISPKVEKIAEPASLSQTATSKGKPTHTPLSTPASNSPLPTPPPARKRTHIEQRLTPARRPTLPDPEVADLQKQQREVQARLASLRSELDTVQQALRIESSNRDEELEALIVKWKKVSQDAAEEVFTGAQERISRMGGVKAWRDRMMNDDVRWQQDEMESWFGDVNTEGLDLDDDELQDRKAEMKNEIEKKRNVEEHEKEPEEFTMDVMLKTLNIDLQSIGYDKHAQNWIKG